MMQREAVKKIADELLTKKHTTEHRFLTDNAKPLVEFLKSKAPNFWQNFGVHWFALADVLQNYAPKEFREYVQSMQIDTDNPDEEIKKMFNYENDLQNWVAAMEYLQERVEMQQLNGEPQQIEIDGDIKDYSPATGFIESETDIETEQLTNGAKI